MPGREIFLGLAHLGALQVADLGRQPLDAGGDQGQGREILRVPVARDHLGRDRLGCKAELFGDVGLDRRVDIGKGADGARDRASRDLCARRGETLPIAGEFGVVPGKLEAKRRRLGMDAVAAADGERVFVLESAPLQRRRQRIEIGEQQVGRLLQLHRQAGVEHVARGHTLVQKPGLGTDVLGEVGQQGDGFVVDLALDLADALDLEGAALAHGARRAFRNDAELGLRLAGVRLDLELNAEVVLGLPDRGHPRAAVARDHDRVASSGNNGLTINISSQ